MSGLKVSSLFSDGMVLQQGVCVPVIGEAEPETEITITLLLSKGGEGKTYRTCANSNGRWRILLDTYTAGGPYVMKIIANNVDTICRYNIYFGDVWVCSGQSNMEMPMERVKDNYPEEWKKKPLAEGETVSDDTINSLIRQFKVPQEWDFSGPLRNFSGGSWVAASAETLKDFSATAWFFAKALFEKHRIPIGLINAAWGGTPVEAWMSREALAAFPEKIAYGEQYANVALCEEIVGKNKVAIKAWDDQLIAGDSGFRRSRGLCGSQGLVQGWHQPEMWGVAAEAFSVDGSSSVEGSPSTKFGTITLPGDFSQTGIENFCGSIWLHRELVLDNTVDGAKLWLGTIVDADSVFINGVEVGNTGYRYPPRKYTVPAGLLRRGKNHIVIRVICNDGQGGVTIDKDFKIFSNNISIELKGTWEYRIGMQMASPRPGEFFFQRQPMGLFNAMIAPMLEYPCKGIIWYQGESNDPNPHEYSALFTAFINDWRNKIRLSTSHYEDMSSEGSVPPFLFVQLPIFSEASENCETDSWAIIREAQVSALSLPATGMAAGLDLGEWNDLHPMNKKGIGRRLALAAEKVVYKNTNNSPGPLLRDHCLQGGKLLLSFDNCSSGLVTHTQPYVNVIARGKIFRLPADIVGIDCLSVDISDIEGAEKIMYAWANNPRDRSLYNADGLPMIPFKLSIG